MQCQGAAVFLYARTPELSQVFSAAHGERETYAMAVHRVQDVFHLCRDRSRGEIIP